MSRGGAPAPHLRARHARADRPPESCRGLCCCAWTDCRFGRQPCTASQQVTFRHVVASCCRVEKRATPCPGSITTQRSRPAARGKWHTAHGTNQFMLTSPRRSRPSTTALSTLVAASTRANDATRKPPDASKDRFPISPCPAPPHPRADSARKRRADPNPNPNPQPHPQPHPHPHAARRTDGAWVKRAKLLPPMSYSCEHAHGHYASTLQTRPGARAPARTHRQHRVRSQHQGVRRDHLRERERGRTRTHSCSCATLTHVHACASANVSMHSFQGSGCPPTNTHIQTTHVINSPNGKRTHACVEHTVDSHDAGRHRHTHSDRRTRAGSAPRHTNRCGVLSKGDRAPHARGAPARVRTGARRCASRAG